MYKAKYKCRMCGKEYYVCFTANKDIAIGAMIDVCLEVRPKQVMSPELYDVHHCKDGSIGLADFHGFKKGEDI